MLSWKIPLEETSTGWLPGCFKALTVIANGDDKRWWVLQEDAGNSQNA